MIWPVKFLLWLLSLPSAAFTWRLAGRLTNVWMRLSPRKREVAAINLSRCYPGLPPAQREHLLRESFRHYVCSVLESGRNWYWPLDRLQQLCDGDAGVELLQRALESGRGVLVLAPHFGAWEFLGMYLQRFPDIAILYKPPAHAGLERALLGKRQRGGARLLPANAKGLRQLYARVQAGQGVGVLPDQEPSAGQGRFAPFFGIPALTAVLGPRLAQRTGCVVMFSVCERLPGGRYRLHVLPAEPEIHAADPAVAAAAVNRGVERCIAIDPAQYLWSYKRFRTRPEDEAPFYR